MANKYVLDTHTLVWYLESNPRLGHQAKAIMDLFDSEMIVPIIVLAECGFLIEKRRISIPSIHDILNAVLADNRIEILQLTWNIFERTLSPEGLRIPELHDRFIVSTGLYLQDNGHTVAILTRDQSIIDANVLPVIW